MSYSTPGRTLNNSWPLFVFPDGGSLCRESAAGGAVCLDVAYAWDRPHDSRLPGRERHFRQGKAGSSSADFNRSATDWWVSLVHLFIYLRIYWVSLVYLFINLFIYGFIGWVLFIYLFIYGFIGWVWSIYLFTDLFGESDLFIYLFIYLWIYWVSLIHLFTYGFIGRVWFIYLCIYLLGESGLFIYLSIYIFLSFLVFVSLLTSASLYSLLRSRLLRLQTGLTFRLYSDLYSAFHNVLRYYKHL